MRLLLILFASFLLVACDFKAEVKPAVEGNESASPSSSKIRNNIDVKSKGVEVEQAFLLYEDGTLVPETNTAKVNQQVTLRLVLKDGWEGQDGKVELGASEKIETNTGEVVLDEKDLFRGTSAVNVQDAGIITLNAVITRLDKLYDHFLVSFRVWNKNNEEEITGSYKLYIQ